jgi:serine/threonine-protein phosphatase 5
MWPDRVSINRGNHETNGKSSHNYIRRLSADRIDMNKVYGFEGEAKAKYGDMTYKLFGDVFTARKCPLRLYV